MHTTSYRYLFSNGLLDGILILSIILLTGCGSSSKPPTTSGLKKRVLLSNPLGSAFLLPNDPFPHASSGAVDIMDASKDEFVRTSNPLSDLSPALHINANGAGGMATAGGITAVIHSAENGISLIDNTKEQISQHVSLPERAEDVAVSPDAADGTVNSVPVPSVRRIVLSPNGSKLLAFSDDPQTLPPPNTNAFFIVDPAARTATAVNVTGLDHPVFGVFSNTETRAFIFNCGAECAGRTASVMLVDFSGSPSLIASVPVAGATVGTLKGSSLYVAGSPPGSPSGTLQTINVGTLTASPPINITDGYHSRMRFGDNSRLYVGATSCTPVNNPTTGLMRGCLTIYNTASGIPKFPEFSALRSSFDVTGIQPIGGRNVVYVCGGGELDIFDTATDMVTKDGIDVVGKAIDVVQIDP